MTTQQSWLFQGVEISSQKYLKSNLIRMLMIANSVVRCTNIQVSIKTRQNLWRNRTLVVVGWTFNGLLLYVQGLDLHEPCYFSPDLHAIYRVLIRLVNICTVNCTACLLACLPACLLACLPAWLLACLLTFLLTCLPAWLLTCLPALLLTCLAACLAACLPSCLSTCLLTCLLACLLANPLARLLALESPWTL